jgi:hypothetical protein
MPTIGSEMQDRLPVALADILHIRQRFRRSVNLERDFYSDDPLNGYILTPSALTAFERLASGTSQTSTRAFTITGPYGTGKSAFALFACKALAATETGGNLSRRRIREQAPNVADKLFENEEEGYWPVLITGSREPVGRSLLRGLVAALKRSPYPAASEVRRALEHACADTLRSSNPSARDVTEVFALASAIASRFGRDCRGLLVVVDELGKLLEYAATYPTQSDMQVLQELAEYAARSTEAPVLLVTILHQAFEDYAFRLSALQRNEWQKVQGRFIDVPFGDGPEVSLRLIAEAIEPRDSSLLGEVVERTLAENLETCRKLKLFPDRLSATEFMDILGQTYPLHPLALLISPHLFRRFGQNERSLFTFLAGDDPFGFQEFLRTRSLGEDEIPILGVEHLYDYVIATMGAAVYSHATAKLWSETEEALFRVQDPLQARLVKVIGLLSILGEQTKILPKKDVLIFALAGGVITKEGVADAIKALEKATLITYRQFKQAYRLYEGSDIDIDARLKEARAHFSQGVDAIKTAATLGSNPPIVARRHSYETGTLRYFDVRYCRTRDLHREILVGPKQGHGLLLLCLTADGQELTTANTTLETLLPQHPHVIVGLNVETEALHEAAVAVETLLWVQNETPELRNDRVAAREVRERLLDAQTAFQGEWDRLLRPQRGMEGGTWYYEGTAQTLASYRALQELVSRACDNAYNKTPRLLNELINRRQLSSSAAAARRNLIEAMIEQRHEFRLGLEGFPPEFSMYASVLQETGIHRLGDGAKWGFYPPAPTRDEGLAAIWEEVEDFLFSQDSVDKSVSRLNEILRRRPYGLADGVIPVLLCAVLLYNEAEVAVYEDGSFVTELDAATFERLIKRPGDFQLKGCLIEGEREAVLDRFARGLLPAGEPSTLLSVIRELFRQFGRLPDYTWKTRKLSGAALGVRDLFKHAREPEKLLFVELPQILGARPFTRDESDGDNTDHFFEQWNRTAREVLGAYAALLGRIEHELLQAFSAQDWQDMKTRAAALLSVASEPQLKAFVLRAGDYQLQRLPWLESVAAGLVGKPPSNWTDADEQRFETALARTISAFRHAEVVAFEKHKTGGEDRLGMRVAVTLDSGAEAARVVLVPKTEASHVEELTERVVKTIKQMLKDEPENIRVAVMGQVVQTMIRGEHE